MNKMKKSDSQKRYEEFNRLTEQTLREAQKDMDSHKYKNDQRKPKKFWNNIINKVNNVKKAIFTLGLVGALSFLPVKGVKAEEASNEIYGSLGSSFLNPTDYNSKLAEVSVGDGFSKASNYGIGYRRLNIFDDFHLNTEFSANSQSIDKYVQNILTGEKRKFGSETLKLNNLDIALEKDFDLGESTKLTTKFGPSLEYALLESINEERSIKSDPILQLGLNAAVGVRRYLGDFFIEPEVKYRYIINPQINTSCFTVGVKGGVKF